ncbi:hypothetical protein ACFLZC_02490 [Patescibacteria group bacterium]
MFYLRALSFLFLLFSSVFFHLSVTIFFFVVFSLFFPKFWEGVLVGVVLDSLYFSPVLFSKFGLGFFTISFIATILIAQKVKHLVQDDSILPKVVLGVFGSVVFHFFLFVLFN